MLIIRIEAFACAVLVLMLGAAVEASHAHHKAASLEKTMGARLLTRGGGESLGSAAAVQKGKITNPSVAAQRLYSAWKKKSKKAGLKVATSEAVSKLFSTKWRPMKFKGCKNTGGSFECIYHDPKIDLDLAMIVEGGASAGYHVESLSFSSEAASLPDKRPQFLTLTWLERFGELTNAAR